MYLDKEQKKIVIKMLAKSEGISLEEAEKIYKTIIVPLHETCQHYLKKKKIK